MNATETMEQIQRKARERYQKDARFHAIVQSVVNRALNEHGPIDPEHCDREAYDIAVKVAAIVIESMFAEDQELAAQREIAERYRKIAEDALAFARPPIFQSGAVSGAESEAKKPTP